MNTDVLQTNRSNLSIVEQDIWDKRYQTLQLRTAKKNDPLRRLIKKYIPAGEGACIEIGAYPCRYLSIFGEMGYTLNGIDTTEKIESPEVKKWMLSNNWKVDILQKISFFEFDTTGGGYSIVYSIGFIEHFENWREVIQRHAALVRKGGYLLLSTPNFRGYIQKKLHTHLDIESFNQHVIESMNPEKWAKILGSDFEIIYKGWFGGFMFWAEEQKRGLLQRALILFLRVTGLILRHIIPSHETYSPYCGLIAKRIQ